MSIIMGLLELLLLSCIIGWAVGRLIAQGAKYRKTGVQKIRMAELRPTRRSKLYEPLEALRYDGYQASEADDAPRH